MTESVHCYALPSAVKPGEDGFNNIGTARPKTMATPAHHLSVVHSHTGVIAMFRLKISLASAIATISLASTDTAAVDVTYRLAGSIAEASISASPTGNLIWQ